MDTTFVDLLTPFLKFRGDRDIAPDSVLRDYGLDSQQAIELLFAIEDQYAVELPEDKLNDQTFATAGSLWEVIEQTRREQTGAVTDVREHA